MHSEHTHTHTHAYSRTIMIIIIVHIIVIVKLRRCHFISVPFSSLFLMHQIETDPNLEFLII